MNRFKFLTVVCVIGLSLFAQSFTEQNSQVVNASGGTPKFEYQYSDVVSESVRLSKKELTEMRRALLDSQCSDEDFIKKYTIMSIHFFRGQTVYNKLQSVEKTTLKQMRAKSKETTKLIQKLLDSQVEKSAYSVSRKFRVKLQVWPLKNGQPTIEEYQFTGFQIKAN
ncbi:MAG: hypothetical protein ACRC5C_13955 [Bacilli bacterium]